MNLIPVFSRSSQTVLIALISLSAGAAEFIPLGDLTGGSVYSRAFDVSANGTVVVGISDSDTGTEAFRWTAAEGMVGMGDLDSEAGLSSLSYSNGVSADGAVIVGFGTNSGHNDREAFRWTINSGMSGLGSLPGGANSSSASGTSADGNVVVGSASSASGSQAFRWTADDGMVGLGDLPGGVFSSEASDASTDGATVIGSSSNASGTEAFRWHNDTGMIGLGELSGGTYYSEATKISADGNTIVGHSNSATGFEAFRWHNDTGMVGLGNLASEVEVDFSSTALDVSADGSLIVGSGTTWVDGLRSAFIWNAQVGMQSLQSILEAQDTMGLDGWTLQWATGISDDGSVIVGHGKNPLGNTEAWMVTGVLSPSVAPMQAAPVRYTTYIVHSGHWHSQQTWNTSAIGSPSLNTYDNGATVPSPLLSGEPAPFDWSPSRPEDQSGTYSGTLIADQSDRVIGGSLFVSGNVAFETRVGQNSWWLAEYDNLTLDFEHGTVASGYRCFDTPLAPSSCDQLGSFLDPEAVFTPIAGNEGVGGAARPAAVFDGTTLAIFSEGFSAPGSGTDYANNFTLNVSEAAEPRLLTAVPDVSGDAVADFSLLRYGSVKPQLHLYSGSDGALIRSIEFFDPTWRAIAGGVLSDGNGDGVAHDPAILLLAQNMITGRIRTQLRSPLTGMALGPDIEFLNAQWHATAVAIVDDINGDGVTSDPAVAVLAARSDGSRDVVEVRSLSDSALLDKWAIFKPNWDAKDLVAGALNSGDAILAVLGTDSLSGASRLMLRRLNNGLKTEVFVFGNQADAKALSIIKDKNGDGIQGDHAVAVLARKANGNNMIRFIDLNTLTKTKDVLAAGNKWIVDDISVAPDINSNGFEELVGLGRGANSDTVLLKVRDFDSGATLLNLYPENYP